MKIVEKLKKFPEKIAILVVIVFAILAARTLIFQSGYFNMHDDLQMMRQLEMEKCFLDGQIPCRWIPDMGYGYGFPLFNFYPPLPYLIGEMFRVLGASFVNTAKLTFAISFMVSGIGMYYLAKEFFGRLGGVLSAVFYIWAPYHAVDVYVRGAMNEAWALMWFPFIFWTAYRLIKDNKNLSKWIIGLTLAWFALFTSHNLMVLIIIPFFTVWLLLHMWREKRWSRIPHLLFSGIFSFLLASFFTIPVLLEQKYVQVSTLIVGYYEYIAHFASLNQLLFSRFWGYGPSVWGIPDGMPFQVGHIHWILSLIVLAILGVRYLKSKKIDMVLLVSVFLFLMGWFSLFMAHSRSTPIWQAIKPLEFVQFPWRFLTMATFAFSFLVGAVPGLMGKLKTRKNLVVKFIVTYFQTIVVVLLSIFLVVFNWKYFLPEHGKMGPLTDEEKFTKAAWELQQTAGIYDYLPNAAKEAPKGPRREIAEIVEGEGEIANAKQGTDWISFDINVDSNSAVVRVGLFDFAGFTAFDNGKVVDIFVPENERWGRMHLVIPTGEHNISIKLFDTWPRTIGNYLSLVSWVGLLLYITFKNKRIGRK